MSCKRCGKKLKVKQVTVRGKNADGTPSKMNHYECLCGWRCGKFI